MQRAILYLFCCLVIFCSISDAWAQTRPRDKIRDNIRERREARQSQALTDEAYALHQQGKMALAADKVEQALRLDERNDRALALSAELAFRHGRREVAKIQAERALIINNRNARAHFVLGLALVADGKLLGGFDHIHKAAALLPPGAELDEARAMLVRLRTQRPDLFKRGTATTSAAPVVTHHAADQPSSDTAELTTKPRVAVFTFENAGAVDSTMKWGETISEMLTTALINSNRFKVMERAQLSKVLQEQALGQTGALDSETAVAVGKIMGLDAVLVGSLSQLASVYEADARILNVESGEAVTAANARAGSVDQFRAIAESLAGKFAAHAQQIPIRAAAADSTR